MDVASSFGSLSHRFFITTHSGGQQKRLLEAVKWETADLEAWETALRVAVPACGAKVLAEMLAAHGSGRREEAVVCRCGRRMESQGLRRKELMTILRPVVYRRSMFRCPSCQATRYPGDEALDVGGTTRSPGLRRMMARAGSQSTFKDGRDDLRIYAGLEVSAKDVERVAERIGQEMDTWSQEERHRVLAEDGPEPERDIPLMYISYDGTGVPMRPEELVGVKGKQVDGVAKTREAKLGCVFTQTVMDKEGYPIRDPESTTFVGAIERAEAFGWRMYGEARRRGLARAQRVVILHHEKLKVTSYAPSVRKVSMRVYRDWDSFVRQMAINLEVVGRMSKGVG